jgi:signal transduction histidine kinase
MEEMQGSLAMSYVHPDDAPIATRLLDGMVDGVPNFGIELRFRHRDGRYLWLSCNCIRRGERIYGNIRDITLARALADDQRRLEEQLRHAQKMEAVGQLTGGIAHDFNNLLASITGGLELAEAHLGAGRASEAMRLLAAAQGAAERASSLTHRLLAFSRRQTLDPRPTDANQLVLALQDLIARTVGPSVEVVVEAAPDLWLTLCDASQLDNALLNLAINARDAMPNGGCLRIRTDNVIVPPARAAARDMAAGSYVCVSVADTGTGMAAEVVARAFDPFFTTKGIGQGTGLGLSMIYGFVRQSGGQAWIETELGVGTTISLYLPRHEGVAVSAVLPRAVAQPDGTPGGKLVLLVDDEHVLREVLAEMLTEAGYRVVQAPDGPAALRLVGEGVRPDMLVTDLGLPGGMNGRDVAEAVSAVVPDLPVLFITGYDGQAPVAAPLAAQVLAKPFGRAALLDRLRAMQPALADTHA